MKVIMKYLIERIESIFVDSGTIGLGLNDHKSEFTKTVGYVHVPHTFIYLTNIYAKQMDVFWKYKINFLRCDIGGL